jgi:(1->4)-alpha-D-glucan 1-alpha-D-glucosylmutase
MTTTTHRPGPGRITPVSTYRLQIHAGFTYDDAAAHAAYLADLGVTHLYLSPILQPAEGSNHGYDVLDHTRIHEEAGGRPAFDRLVEACREHDLGLVVDVVPNHMTVPQPTHLNVPFWSLLRDGRESPYATWFDIDWDVEDDRILMPVLGAPVEDVIAKGELRLTDDGGPSGRDWVLWYYDNEFPVRPGTEDLPLPELVAAQAYRLSSWREAGDALNYRRFFDVTSLVAVRVEDPVVFAATHALLVSLFGHGAIDGLRIDHPDGLADPAAYLSALADATGDGYVVVEKILEGDEELPTDWRCMGTTGYDALLRIQQVFTDGAGAEALDRLWAEHAAGTEVDGTLPEVIIRAKRLVVEDVQAAEVDRLMRLVDRVLPSEDPGALRRGLEALLIAMDRYRAYFAPGEEADVAQYAVIEQAEERALDLVAPEDREAVSTIAQLVRGGRLPQAQLGERDVEAEFRTRFQQTCGPVMAKGIEDTAFYRWLRLAGANEVGGHPAHLGISAQDFHAYAAGRLQTWPVTMTTLTTHDTKRSEDVRARLMVLAHDPGAWETWVREASRLGAEHRSDLVDPPTEYLIWQTLVGTWPITAARLEEYLLKAVREAKVHTAWVDGDPAYEEAVTTFATGVLRDPAVRAHLDAWVAATEPVTRSAILGQRVVQLLMPGVPDVYQGCELVTLTLVDPDNRRPVLYGERAERLARLDEGEPPVDLDDEKLLVMSRALRLRREHPEWFVGDEASYAAWPAPEGVLAFTRGDATGSHVLVAAAIKGATTVDSADIELPEGDWTPLWVDDLPVRVWVRAS